MTRKDIADEELYENFDSSLSQYTQLVNEANNTSPLIFDEIAIVEERYSHGNIVNQGGMKKIYRTTDSLTNRTVAKAVLLDSEDERKAESFLREARLTAALEHPNIIPIYDIGIDEKEGPYFIMKLIGGQNLSDILKKHKKEQLEYTLQDFMGIFVKICDAVAYAHSKGIIHLDLKPENIQIGDYGEVTVCDWGLAKVMETPEDISDFEADLDPMLYNDMTMHGVIKGTPGFMAPEQIDTSIGEKDQRTDVYALGGILYSLLTLKSPHKTDTVENLFKYTLEGAIQPPSTRSDEVIPASLEAVAMKALETNPDKRYQSVVELRREINNWLGGFATEAENAGFLKSSWLLLKRHKTVSLLLSLLFAGTVMAFYFVKLNELKAKEALNKYEKEKKFSDLISSNSIIQLKVINNNYLNSFDFQSARKFIEDALRLYPDNKEVNALNGEIHFYTLKFSQAVEAFNRSGIFKTQKPYSQMFNIASKFSIIKDRKGELAATDLVDLMDSCESKVLKDRILANINEKFSSVNRYRKIYENPETRSLIDRHMEFCRLMTYKEGEEDFPNFNKIESRKKFSYSLDQNGVHLDLSGNKVIDKLNYIRHLPLISLNLKDTPFWRKWIFNHYSLKITDIRNTKIQKMVKDDHTNNKLTEVIMTQEQFDMSHKGLRSTQDRLKLIVK